MGSWCFQKREEKGTKGDEKYPFPSVRIISSNNV